MTIQVGILPLLLSCLHMIIVRFNDVQCVSPINYLIKEFTVRGRGRGGVEEELGKEVVEE